MAGRSGEPMNIDVSKLQLREGNLAVKFLDEDDDDEDDKPQENYGSPEPVPYEGCLAMVVAVGPKVSGVKPGSIVVTGPYARNGMKLGDSTLISAYDVIGSLKS